MPALKVSLPNCEKCSAPMHLLASIPPVHAGGGSANVFMCTPCNWTKWVEESPTPTLWF